MLPRRFSGQNEETRKEPTMSDSVPDRNEIGSWSQRPQSEQTDTQMQEWNERSGQADYHHQLPHHPTSGWEDWDGVRLNQADNGSNSEPALDDSMYPAATTEFRGGIIEFTMDTTDAHLGQYNHNVRVDYGNEYPYVSLICPFKHLQVLICMTDSVILTTRSQIALALITLQEWRARVLSPQHIQLKPSMMSKNPAGSH
jgi:hypothetical protein